MHGSFTSHAKIDSASSDFDNIIDNWALLPITAALTVVGAVCPTGYEKVKVPDCELQSSLSLLRPILAYPPAAGPGASTAGCACPSGAVHDGRAYTSGSGSCSENQTKALCYQDAALPEVPLATWVGSSLCYTRGGQAAFVSKGKEPDIRPTITKKSTCASGYRACGTGAFNAHRGTCVPDEAACPITTIEAVAAGGAEDEAIGTLQDALHDSNAATVLSVSREEDSLLPIVDFTVAFSGTGRGVCYASGKGEKYVVERASLYYYYY